MRLVLVFGIAFLLPELLVALNRLGLMKGTTMLKGWRWAVLLIFTFMAFANPLPDPWSMIFMALPITGLYFLACFLSIRHDKHVAKRRAEEDAALDAALAPKAPALSNSPRSWTGRPICSACHCPQARERPSLSVCCPSGTPSSHGRVRFRSGRPPVIPRPNPGGGSCGW